MDFFLSQMKRNTNSVVEDLNSSPIPFFTTINATLPFFTRKWISTLFSQLSLKIKLRLKSKKLFLINYRSRKIWKCVETKNGNRKLSELATETFLGSFLLSPSVFELIYRSWVKDSWTQEVLPGGTVLFPLNYNLIERLFYYMKQPL